MGIPESKQQGQIGGVGLDGDHHNKGMFSKIQDIIGISRTQ